MDIRIPKNKLTDLEELRKHYGWSKEEALRNVVISGIEHEARTLDMSLGLAKQFEEEQERIKNEME